MRSFTSASVSPRQLPSQLPSHFRMKVHVGTDTRGVVHSLTTTDAAQADVNQLPELIRGSEGVLYGDRAYLERGGPGVVSKRGCALSGEPKGEERPSAVGAREADQPDPLVGAGARGALYVPTPRSRW